MCDPSIKQRSDKIREFSAKLKGAEITIREAHVALYLANKAIGEVIAEAIRMHIDLSELY